MTDDLKSFKAPRWKLDALFVGLLILCGVAWYFFTEPQRKGGESHHPDRSGTKLGTGAAHPNNAAYTPCTKLRYNKELRQWKWLIHESAQQWPGGYMVECVYEGDGAIFARDDVRL